MKALRFCGSLFLALVLAAGLSACQKQAESELSDSTMEESPATFAEPMVETTTPPVETPEPAPAPAAPKAAKKPAAPKRPATQAVPAAETRTVALPAGATFDVELATRVHTGESNVGDPIQGKLLQPLMAPDGSMIAAQGAVIRGEIAELKRASKSRSEEDRATVKLAFTSIETVDGEKTLAATVTNVDALKAGSTTKRDALVIGGSTVAGAVLGKVIGKDTKGAMIGALGGAVLGTGAVMAAKGHELELPAGTKVSLRSDRPITIVSR